MLVWSLSGPSAQLTRANLYFDIFYHLDAGVTVLSSHESPRALNLTFPLKHCACARMLLRPLLAPRAVARA